jgi:hypothetical protein
MVLGISPLVFVLFFATHDDSIPFGLVILILALTILFAVALGLVAIDECDRDLDDASDDGSDD